MQRLLQQSTTYAGTLDWQTQWGQSSFATGVQGYRIGNFDFVVKPTDTTNYNQMGNMGVKKVCNQSWSSCVYWWGYTTQVNFQTPLATNGAGILQQYMIIQGQDVANPNGNLNFQCIWTTATTPAAPATPVPASGRGFSDCGSDDISLKAAPTAPADQNWNYYRGDYKPYISNTPTAGSTVCATRYCLCPNSSPQSNFITAVGLTQQNSWFSNSCTTYRSSGDIFTNVKTYSPSNPIKFKAGYNVWSGTSIVSSGKNSDWQTFTFTDSATSLTMSFVASAVLALLF